MKPLILILALTVSFGTIGCAGNTAPILVANSSVAVADIIGQLLRFPAGKHDDAVDVCGLIGRGLQFIGHNRKSVVVDWSKSAAQGARI